MAKRVVSAERALAKNKKWSKTQVAYVPAGNSRRRCYNCTYFEEGPKSKSTAIGDCTIVKGEIRGYMTCKLFESDQEMLQ